MSNQDSDLFQTEQVPGQPKTQEAAQFEDLERVREIILGPDIVRQKLRMSEVDRLRDIIFGAQMEEYERRFTDLRRETERTLTDLRTVEDRVSEFEKAVTKRIEALELETRRFNDELQRAVERQRSQEGIFQQILTQARQQDMALQTLSESTRDVRKAMDQHANDMRSISAAASEYHEQNERKLQTLKHEIRQAENDLRTELRRFADRLDYQKTDRKALASMLIEIATRLETGSSVTHLLEGLTNNSKE